MPNPVRPLKRTDKLSERQKDIVRKLRRNKIPVRVYKRGRGVSVHDPFLDIRKKAKVGDIRKTKRYPHARDTPTQRSLRSVKKAPSGARKVTRKRKKSFLLP